MTTIAYYDGVMAGDRKAVTSNAHVFSVAKVGKIGGWLYGFSGDLMPEAVVKTMALERITEGKPLEGVWGSSGWKDGGYVGGYLVSPDKEIYRVESDKEGVVACARVYAEFVACGSGRDFALAAMSLGKQPERAVFVASQFDVNTGIECDVVKLDSEIWEPASPPDVGLPAQEDSHSQGGLPAHDPNLTEGHASIEQQNMPTYEALHRQVKRLADQKTIEEMEADGEDDLEDADFEGGYNSIIEECRRTIDPVAEQQRIRKVVKDSEVLRGTAARQEGKLRTDNPNEEFTDYRSWWDIGWCSADTEIQEREVAAAFNGESRPEASGNPAAESERDVLRIEQTEAAISQKLEDVS